MSASRKRLLFDGFCMEIGSNLKTYSGNKFGVSLFQQMNPMKPSVTFLTQAYEKKKQAVFRKTSLFPDRKRKELLLTEISCDNNQILHAGA